MTLDGVVRRRFSYRGLLAGLNVAVEDLPHRGLDCLPAAAGGSLDHDEPLVDYHLRNSLHSEQVSDEAIIGHRDFETAAISLVGLGKLGAQVKMQVSEPGATIVDRTPSSANSSGGFSPRCLYDWKTNATNTASAPIKNRNTRRLVHS
jgi:hypothetical protein